MKESFAVGDDTLLDLIGDTVGVLEIDEFRTEFLAALHRAISADWVTLNDIGPDPQGIVVVSDLPMPNELLEKFARFAQQNPLIERYGRTRDGRAYRFSDVASGEELRATDLYKEVYGPLGVEHQIAFTLPHSPDRVLGVALSRSEPDFTDDERDFLNRARPFLIQGYRNAIVHSDLLQRATASNPAPLPPLEPLIAMGLSRREAEVVRLAAGGAADRDIASELQISHRTVQKHLEHCYRRLGVDSRSRAAAVIWSTVG